MPHQVITGPGQLVGHRLVSHGHASFRLLALGRALDARLPSHGQVRRFCIGPCQVRRALVHIAWPLSLAVAHLRAVHAPPIRSIIPSLREAPDVTRFPQNGLDQNGTDARHRLAQLVAWWTRQPGTDPFFHGLDLLRQTTHDREGTGDREGLVGVRSECVHLVPAQLFHAVCTQPSADVTDDEVLKAQHIGGPLLDQMAPLPQYIPHWPLGLGREVALRSHAAP